MKQFEHGKKFPLAAGLGIALLGFSTPARAAWETPVLPTSQIAEQNAAPAPGITATLNNPFFKITAADVNTAVAEQLQTQAVETKAEVTLNAGSPAILYSADHPLKLVIHTLQVDTQAKHWQAQAYILADGKTEVVKPIGGNYDALIDVPVVTRQLSKGDVIEAKDLKIISVPERQLRKDTVTDQKTIIGLSPRNGISPNRPIHNAEITQPTLIKRGELVEMLYTTPYIHIKTTGVALEDGQKGGSIRVKNEKSQIAVSARVVAAGRVQVSNDATL